jgi:uncharacterized protein YabE (DUF348 family)
MGALAALTSVAVLVAWMMRVQRIPVTVIVSGTAHHTQSRANTVSELLGELSIPLHEGDAITPALGSALEPDMVIRVEKARSVSLTVNGETRLLRTTLANPRDILTSAGIEATDLDRIMVDGTDTSAADLAVWPVPPASIILRRAAPVHILDEGTEITVSTTGETVGEALFEAGVTLYLADTVSPDLSALVRPDMQVEIYRSRPVSIIADGETVQTRTQGETVADVLVDAGVALVGLDYTIPRETARLVPGMHIRVIRVREEIITEAEPIAFETIYRANAQMELDQEAVAQGGAEGIQQARVRVRYENGIEISREVVETAIIDTPTDQIIDYGTNIIVRAIDTPQGPREYWRVLRMYATSYHPEAVGGNTITATGAHLQQGIVSANPNILPYGTQIFVDGYGVGEIADTGSRRQSPMWVDLGYSDDDYQHWSHYVEVYVLTPIPETIDYILPN